MKNFANGIKTTNQEIILDFPGRLSVITGALKHKRKAEESVWEMWQKRKRRDEVGEVRDVKLEKDLIHNCWL